MRIRTVKPEFWYNEELASVSEAANLLAIGLLNYCDDEGYFKANLALIKSSIFPLREPSCSVTVMLRELSGIGYIELSTGTDGHEYGHVVNFLKHQVVNHSQPSKIKGLFGVPVTLPECSGNATVTLLPGMELNGMGIGMEKEYISEVETSPLPVEAQELPFLEAEEIPREVPPTPIERVVSHYKSYHPRARPGKKETALIATRMRSPESWGVDDLCRAIDGYHADQWHKERGVLGVNYIFRDSSHVQKGIDLTEKAPTSNESVIADFVANIKNKEQQNEVHDAK